MNKRALKIVINSIFLILCAFTTSQVFAAENALSYLKVPAGYQVSLFKDDLPGARSLALSDSGTVFVGTRESEVYAVKDGKKYIIAKGLDMPNGVAIKNGDLYVAEVSRILKFPKIDSHLENPGKPEVVYDKFPTEKHHGWKFIAFGPDGYLYVPVGAPCNVCEPKPDQFAAIFRFKKLDGSAPELYANGIRNTVGFAWQPGSNQLWFTENGRDMMGDDVPADELNFAPKSGMNFGFPYCHQGDLPDPEFGKKHACSEFTPPEWKFPAHAAVLGMRFIDANTILVAQHGSWNRSKKSGYQVVKVNLRAGRVTSVEPFVTGFLQPGEKTVGRPVDVMELKDHSILVSDDDKGAIYRVTRKP
jgi:glucose/arabinose dehydrogenase